MTGLEPATTGATILRLSISASSAMIALEGIEPSSLGYQPSALNHCATGREISTDR